MNPKYSSRFELKHNVWVFVPTDDCIQEGNRIKSLIEERWDPPAYFFHLKKGGHVRALQSHTHNELFIHVDIKNFFGSINRSRVTRCLKGFFSYIESREIAINSTTIHPIGKHPILPFGFVQSPLIASICLDKSALGKYLKTLQRNSEIEVSVYVDDIIISTNNKSLFSDLIKNLESAANKAKLPLNELKTQGPANNITAFNIDLSYQNLAISDARFSRFISSFQNTDNDHKKDGIKNYVRSVNPTQGKNIN